MLSRYSVVFSLLLVPGLLLAAVETHQKSVKRDEHFTIDVPGGANNKQSDVNNVWNIQKPAEIDYLPYESEATSNLFGVFKTFHLKFRANKTGSFEIKLVRTTKFEHGRTIIYQITVN